MPYNCMGLTYISRRHLLVQFTCQYKIKCITTNPTVCIYRFLIVHIIIQDAQLPQRNRATGCVSFCQNWKAGTGRQYFTDIRL